MRIYFDLIHKIARRKKMNLPTEDKPAKVSVVIIMLIVFARKGISKCVY